ncbi:hypothetical protein HOF92_10890, partial [bacterium]|nr:hypothetical protein [bacterium]
MRLIFLGILILVTNAFTESPFGIPGGEEVKKVDEVFGVLLEEKYDLEVLMSFGTSSKGSAGHLALSIREGDDETVYSANFYADRT